MKNVILFREPSTDEGTFGYMTHLGDFWHSLELPNRNNEKNFSSIPQGEYICKIRFSPHFKRNTFHLQDVAGRTYILIHGANLAGDTKKGYQSHLNGCIALGRGRGTIKNKYGKLQKAILTSRTAIREFMELMDDEDFKLTIKEL